MYRRELKPCLRFHELPILGGRDEFVPVQAAEAVLVRKESTRCCLVPVGIFCVDDLGGAYSEVLKVAPSEVRARRDSTKAVLRIRYQKDLPNGECESINTSSVGRGS